MSARRDRTPAVQMMVGVCVIVIGMLFLLDNLGWLDLDLRLHILPTVLIVAGVLKLVQTRTGSGVAVGGFLILFGGLILLKEAGLITIAWRTLWPLLLIGAGGVVVFKATVGRKEMEAMAGGPLAKAGEDTVVKVTAVMGGYKSRMTTQDFRGGELTVIMGGCDLDLRQASINGDAVLNVFALFGGITIKVPIDWSVVVQGTPILGAFDEKTVPPGASGKRLIIRGYCIMGGMEVRN
jgi:predicted membrane protein